MSPSQAPGSRALCRAVEGGSVTAVIGGECGVSGPLSLQQTTGLLEEPREGLLGHLSRNKGV